MNKAGGYIAIHRQITEWEWYKDSSTKDLFIHLLVTANFKDTRFMGKTIRRGQVVTSLPSLAEETGLSIQNVRTALKHLISTGEVTDKSNRQYRVITIVKYDDYQKPTDNLTVSQQTANRRLTDSQQYHNNDNKVNKVNKGINTSYSATDRAFTDSFDQFWKEYPKKVAKQSALKAWKKINPDDELFRKIMDGLKRWKDSGEWDRDGGQYIPYPASWLNGSRWEDEISKKVPVQEKLPAKLPAQNYEQRDYSGEQDAAMDRLMAWAESRG